MVRLSSQSYHEHHVNLLCVHVARAATTPKPSCRDNRSRPHMHDPRRLPLSAISARQQIFVTLTKSTESCCIIMSPHIPGKLGIQPQISSANASPTKPKNFSRPFLPERHHANQELEPATKSRNSSKPHQGDEQRSGATTQTSATKDRIPNPSVPVDNAPDAPFQEYPPSKGKIYLGLAPARSPGDVELIQ